MGSVGTFAVPGLIGLVVDAMTKPDSWHKINLYCGGMAIIIVISSLGVWLRAATFNTISEKIAQNLRYDLFMHIITKDVGFFDANKTGDILSRMSSDIQIVQNGLGTNVSMLTRSFVTMIAILIVMCFI